MSERSNAAQVDYWNDAPGRTWAQMQAPLDRQLEPLGRRAMEALAPRAGERVLDIGCGSGATTVMLAEAVAPGGEAVGCDISRPMLEVARGRTQGMAGIRFLEADAQTEPFAPASFDAALSRFGVMFFEDPTAAFTNIGRALKPGGRLAFVCWRTPFENPFMVLPMMAAPQHLPPSEPPDPTAPGPFAFADPDRVRRILADSGFEAIQILKHDQKIGSGDLEMTLDLALRIGPLGRALRENPDSREAVVGSVREALAAHAGPDGVKLDSAAWIVSART
jgi:SAM-dependent methyltransferase